MVLGQGTLAVGLWREVAVVVLRLLAVGVELRIEHVIVKYMAHPDQWIGVRHAVVRVIYDPIIGRGKHVKLMFQETVIWEIGDVSVVHVATPELIRMADAATDVDQRPTICVNILVIRHVIGHALGP